MFGCFCWEEQEGLGSREMTVFPERLVQLVLLDQPAVLEEELLAVPEEQVWYYLYFAEMQFP